MAKFLQRLLTVSLIILMTVVFSEKSYAQYCTPDYISGTTDNDYIDRVVLGDIDNTSGAGDDLNDFTYLSTTLNTGLEYTLELYNTPSWGEYYNAWIDYNQDEVFSTDERLSVDNLFISAGASGTITFTVPFTAFPGTTRMRVMCIYGLGTTEMDPCHSGIYSFGEAEDYSIEIPAAGPYDLGVTAITSIATDCGLGTESVTIDITNFGTDPSGSFNVKYQLVDPIDGPLGIVTQAYTGAAIASLETVSFTFTIPIDASNLGLYSLTSYTDYALDDQPLNDTTNITFSNIPIVSTFPYYEEFEGGPAGWTSSGTNSTWELGSPAGPTINTPPIATPTSVNSWATSLTGYYNFSENSYVTGPCFDFTSLVQPYFEMDIWYETGDFWDGANVEYSLDAGTTWTTLGSMGSGEGWYTGDVYSFGYDPVLGYEDGWEGTNSGWQTVHHDLSFLAGEPSVMMRVHFASYLFYSLDGVAFDNIRIQDPWDHDIGVSTLVSPISTTSLGAAETITVTIENYGINDESGFPVSYQVDGGAVVTETFTGTLPVGTSADFTFSATYDFSADGDYDFCAWTGLASDEDVSNDMLCYPISNLVPITGSDAYYVYSNIYGGAEPWYTTSNSDAMDVVYGAGEWTQAYFEDLDVATVFGLGTCFVFLEGGDVMASELENFLNTNYIAIQNWVAAGGHLLINSAPNEGDGMDLYFGGVELTYPYYSTYEDDADPDHPIWAGPYTPVSTGIYGYNFSHATVTGSGINPIISDLYDVTKYTLVEKTWGAGDVLFGGMTPSAFHYPAPDATNLRQNIISYLSICTLADIDMGVTSIITPTTGCGLGSETVSVKVRNFGFETQVDIPVRYQVDAASPVTQILPGPVAPGEIVEMTFTIPADLSVIGTHTITAWTEMTGDPITSNDSTDEEITSIPVVSTFPYTEDFEDGASGWSSGGINNTWELGSPAGPTITGAPPTTPTSVNSWATSLTGYYNYNENSYVLGPCFDFSSLTIPYLKMDLWYETGDFWDGVNVEYSLDAGATWTILGSIGSGEGWYTGDVYSFGYDPVTGYGDGWEGTNGGWQTVKHDLTFLAGEPQVSFRIHFASYSFYSLDGVAFDNINIQDPWPDDIGVSDLITPSSAVTLGTSEVVSVLIQNYGTNTQSTFDVSYRVDGGAIHTEAYDGAPIPAASSGVFTFVATEDFSVDGLYSVTAWTELAGDDDISNDTLDANVLNLSPVTGTDAYYINSNVYGGADPWYTYENQDAMDTVFGEGAWTYEHFETLDLFSVFSESTCFVFIDGSDGMASELETFLDENGEMVENWVASGGNLFLNSAPNEGDGMDFGFDDISLVYPYFSDYVTPSDPGHPIFSGPYTPVTGDLYGTSFAHSTVSGGSLNPLMEYLYDGTQIVLAEEEWGSGTLIVGGMTTPNFHTPTDEARNLRKNIIDYLKLCAPVDVGVSALIAPESGCGLGAETSVTIEITNYGPSTVSSIPVKYTVDGTLVGDEVAPGPIDPGATYEYTFTATASLITGDYEICAYTEYGGDGDGTNDMTCATVTSLASPTLDLGPNQTICDEYTIDAGNPGSTYSWSTGETTQTIVVTETGTYSVTVTDPTTGCSIIDAITVTVNYSPTASFTYVAVGLVVTFSNESTGGSSYLWDFGDGSTSTETSPTHTYATGGLYPVTLTVTNSCGSDVYTSNISVSVSIEDIDLINGTSIYPNPTSGLTVVDLNFAQIYDVKMELVNTLGQTVLVLNPGFVSQGAYEIDMRNFADGVYQLKVTADEHVYSKQIVLTK